MSCLGKNLRCIFIASIAANILLFLILAGVFLYKNVVKKDNVSDVIDSQIKLPGGAGVCLPCDYLGDKITAEDTLFDSITTSNDGKHKLCCTNKPSFLPELIGKVIYSF